MPLPSDEELKAELDREMMEWFDQLQERKATRPPRERPEIEVRVENYTFTENTAPIPTAPPDEIYQ